MSLGISLRQAEMDVANFIFRKIVVGHALHNDFSALKIRHPSHLTRDTAKYAPLRAAIGATDQISLKQLALKLLNKKIHVGKHNSVEDARTSLELYKLYRNQWENSRNERV